MPPEDAAPPANPEEAPDKVDPEESAYCFLDSTRPCSSSCVAYVPQYRPTSPAKGSPYRFAVNFWEPEDWLPVMGLYRMLEQVKQKNPNARKAK